MLSLLNFASLVNAMAAAVQGAAAQIIDLSIGSVTRALLEAQASVALWMQWLIVRVLQTTRAATSVGSDLDSWVGDFGVTRLPGSVAVGAVTMARWTPTSPATVPVGTSVRTANGSEIFNVVEDPTNAAWNAAANGYIVAAGVSSIVVPVAAAAAGAAGNVSAGSVTLLASAVPGIDTVANAAAFSGGADAEGDAALRVRFALYMDSRSKATRTAVEAAIVSTQQGLRWLLTENADPSGAMRPGFFTITLDDGSGNPPPATLNAVSAAVDAVRPLGTMFAVVPPQIINVTVTLTLAYVAGAPTAVVNQNVSASVTQFIDALAIGTGLPISRVAQLAYDADPGVANVTGVLLNGQASDLLPQPTGELRPVSVVIA